MYDFLGMETILVLSHGSVLAWIFGPISNIPSVFTSVFLSVSESVGRIAWGHLALKSQRFLCGQRVGDPADKIVRL